MKSLTTKLNEAIQDSEDTIITNSRIETSKKIASDLVNKLNAIPHGKQDILGRNFKVGDIILRNGNHPGVVLSLDSEVGKKFIRIYNSYTDKEEDVNIFDLMILIDPINYLRTK